MVQQAATKTATSEQPGNIQNDPPDATGRPEPSERPRNTANSHLNFSGSPDTTEQSESPPNINLNSLNTTERPERPESPPDSKPHAEESGVIGITHEKKYYDLTDDYRVFVKRSLSPSEYLVNRWGKVVRPRLVKERLQNEVAAIAFLKARTTIPLPNVLCAFEDHGRYYVITELVPGIDLRDVPLEQQGPILEELQTYREQLSSLKSNIMGGLAGHACLPYRLHSEMGPLFGEDLKFREAETDEFVFIHGDLGQHNIIVDEKTHNINAIIDWEYAGFYPQEFEGAFWLRSGPSAALQGEEDDVEKLLAVIKKWRI